MNSNDLADALLKQDSGTDLDPCLYIEKQFRRDRWLVRIIGGLAALLWLVAVGGMVGIDWGFFIFFLPKMNQLLSTPPADAHQQWAQLVRAVGSSGPVLVNLYTISLILAALTTLLLIFISHRANVRQITTGLAEISRQLKELRMARK